MNEREFGGKVALITGSAGIASAAALRLARGGASVVAMGISAKDNDALESAANAESLHIHAVLGDVSKEADVEAAVHRAVEQGGGLDVIVNAAAVHPYGDAVETDWQTWRHCLDVNVGGMFLTAHFGVTELKKRGGGAIVNLASVQGYACQRRVNAYATSKGAIHAFTRSLALDCAPYGIRVNSVSPGSVRTPMLERAAHIFDGPNADVGAVLARWGAAHPLGRVGEPEEIAEMIAFLASDRAAFCTGADFVIDGGLKAAIGVA